MLFELSLVGRHDVNIGMNTFSQNTHSTAIPALHGSETPGQ
jgi:hypothetical protein